MLEGEYLFVRHAILSGKDFGDPKGGKSETVKNLRRYISPKSICTYYILLTNLDLLLTRNGHGVSF